MKTQDVFFCLAFSAMQLLQAQGSRGLLPVVPPPAPHTGGATHALVVGISDYQHIADLAFAHKDAEAFAAFLQSPAGGSIDAGQLILLLDEQATAGQVSMALYRLLENCRENDRVIIYFSGHCDVEWRVDNGSGFLLCWDALPSYYSCGGGVSMDFLEDVVQTLTVKNRCKVWLTIDACHSGKLAGSILSGPGIAMAGMFRLMNDATIILSCQPGELSHEGVRWGGGRGVFSFHLLNALYGLADQNHDRQITLKEVNDYLDSKIPPDTAPLKQNAVTIGDKEAVLSQVDPALLKNLMEPKFR